MTHDELLSKIDSYLIPTKAHLEEPNFAVNTLQALRAVLELHKPREYKIAGTFTDGLIQTGCVCGGWSYPCPTIQAIEKELE